MAEGNDDDGQEKTEEPTERKKQKATEEGNILTSKELLMTASLISGALILYFASNIMYMWFMDLMKSSLQFDDILHGNRMLQFVMFESILQGVFFVSMFSIPIIVNIILSQSVFGGIRFSSASLEPKLSKLDPIKGLQRILGINSLVEMLKSVIKIIITASFACIFIYIFIDEIVALPFAGISGIMTYISDKVLLLFLILSFATALVSMIDILYQKYRYIKNLRMSHQEMKDESKETQGSPEVRAKIRQRQREMVGSRAGSDVSEAHVVLVNPTHFAVAMRYAPEHDSAPIVVVKGKGHPALKIKQEAEDAGIPVLLQPDLTRAIYFSSDVNKPVHEGLYKAVAVIFAHIFRNNEDTLPDLEVPDSFMFDERGKSINH